ncbi:MAG TPA: ATP-binding protein [Flavisolibacter sp.]|nr:ATP-binding protein [Flavisolibacter sp.]
MKTFMSWSGGKDSALSLYKAQQENVAVEALVTTVNKSFNRIAMHGVRRELLQQQASALDLPLRTIELPEMPGMEVYEEAVRNMHQQLKSAGFLQAVFGDVFLEDLKKYREELLAKDGLQCLFPLWGMSSDDVVKQFLGLGFKAIVVCVNNAHLSNSYCGRLMDEQFFRDLPPSVDPCGENGEYHSFVFDGPNFSAPVPFTRGEMVFREYPAPKTSDDCFTAPQPVSGFYFCDLLPA